MGWMGFNGMRGVGSDRMRYNGTQWDEMGREVVGWEVME